LKVKVLAMTSDLFLQSRIIELTRSLGISAKIVASEADVLREAGPQPSLVILDLTATDYDPFSIAQKLKNMASPPRLLAAFPHIRTELRIKAENAGIDYVIPNSAFLKTLKTILEKEL